MMRGWGVRGKYQSICNVIFLMLSALLVTCCPVGGEDQKREVGSTAPCTEKQGQKKCPPKPTFAGQYPFVGSLDDNSTNLCVVTAVSEEWVITVYSCFKSLRENLTDGNITVPILHQAGAHIRIPNHNLDEEDIGENSISITEVAQSEPIGNERLVLLKLFTPMSSELVDNVNIGAQKNVDKEEECLTVGWNPIRYTDTISLHANDTKLKDIGQTLVIKKICQDATNLDTAVCGRSVQEERASNICKFETGSPLLCEDGSSWTLIGVTGDLVADDSTECSQNEKLSFYIHIESFIPWIYSQIRKDSSTEEPTEKT